MDTSAARMPEERRSLIPALGLLLLVSSALAHAQVTTADLVGTIKDSSGAVVPGVTITLTPGSYGEVKAGGGSVLNFSGAGDYYIQRIDFNNGLDINVTFNVAHTETWYFKS